MKRSAKFNEKAMKRKLLSQTRCGAPVSTQLWEKMTRPQQTVSEINICTLCHSLFYFSICLIPTHSALMRQ